MVVTVQATTVDLQQGRSVLMDCDCPLIDCLYDYAPGGYGCISFAKVKYANNVQTYIKHN